MTIHWKAGKLLSSTLILWCCSIYCGAVQFDFGEFISFGLGTVRSKSVEKHCQVNWSVIFMYLPASDSFFFQLESVTFFFSPTKD